MNMLLAVFIGGGIGSLARHFSILGAVRFFGEGFPYGTLIVNVLGSFLIGAIMEASALKFNMPLETRALLVTGFLGGFTTFSAFSFDVLKLADTGQYFLAALYAGLSLFLSLIAVFGGVYLMRGVLN